MNRAVAATATAHYLNVNAAPLARSTRTLKAVYAVIKTIGGARQFRKEKLPVTSSSQMIQISIQNVCTQIRKTQ